MKLNKSLLFIPLTVLFLGLTSCNNYKNINITENNNFTYSYKFDSQEITMDTFGYNNLEFKNNESYKLNVNITNGLSQHAIHRDKPLELSRLSGVLLPLYVNENSLVVKYNGSSLPKYELDTEELITKDGYCIQGKTEDSIMLVFSQPVTNSIQDNKKGTIEVTFKVSQNIDKGICALLYSE